MNNLAEISEGPQIVADLLSVLFKQLYLACRWLHRLGIIHCDVKPAVTFLINLANEALEYYI
jgi:serine/threonine protein kinase